MSDPAKFPISIPLVSSSAGPQPVPSPVPASTTRRPFDLDIAKSLVDASISMLHQVAGGRQKDQSYLALLKAVREQHMEIALAEFEARLPAVTTRNGGGAIEKSLDE